MLHYSRYFMEMRQSLATEKGYTVNWDFTVDSRFKNAIITLASPNNIFPLWKKFLWGEILPYQRQKIVEIDLLWPWGLPLSDSEHPRPKIGKCSVVSAFLAKVGKILPVKGNFFSGPKTFSNYSLTIFQIWNFARYYLVTCDFGQNVWFFRQNGCMQLGVWP